MVELLRFIEIAQRDGMARVTAYGMYRKEGGTVSARTFGRLWRLARVNPLRFRGL